MRFINEAIAEINFSHAGSARYQAGAPVATEAAGETHATPQCSEGLGTDRHVR
jgi:hypothetical protein